MPLNEGKKFERDFRASVPKDVYYLRIRDSASFVDWGNEDMRFSSRSPYDVVLCRRGQMYALELKSHMGKSMSFGTEETVIKQHQVDSLMDARSGGAVAGLVLNYREVQETYFVPVYDFWMFTQTSGKKSINVKDAAEIGRRMLSKKLRTTYRYDVSVLWK